MADKDKELKIYSEDGTPPAKKVDISPYSPDVAEKPLTRQDVRDILLAEMRQFRTSLAAPWGGLGNSGPTVGGDLFGFFTKQPHGFFNQSPHQAQGTVDATTGIGTRVAGNDFGRIFVEELPDTGSDTPSWSFDLPAYSQKMLIKSTGPGLVYNTETAAFAVGEKITGGTSGATAFVSAVFPDGTDGTLYLYNVVGTFTDTEAISGNLGGAATITRLTYTRTNPIVRVYGVGGESADSAGSIFTFWGLVDLFCPIGLFNQPSSVNGTARDVEQIPAFENNGTLYVRNTSGTRAVRVYLNGAWQDFGGAGGGTPVISAHTRSMSASAGNVSYAHGASFTPGYIEIVCNRSAENSFGSWDGTTTSVLKVGTLSSGFSSGSIAYVASSAGNFIFADSVVSVDGTNVTLHWDKSGSPSGTVDIKITVYP